MWCNNNAGPVVGEAGGLQPTQVFLAACTLDTCWEWWRGGCVTCSKEYLPISEAQGKGHEVNTDSFTFTLPINPPEWPRTVYHRPLVASAGKGHVVHSHKDIHEESECNTSSSHGIIERWIFLSDIIQQTAGRAPWKMIFVSNLKWTTHAAPNPRKFELMLRRGPSGDQWFKRQVTSVRRHITHHLNLLTWPLTLSLSLSLSLSLLFLSSFSVYFRTFPSSLYPQTPFTLLSFAIHFALCCILIPSQLSLIVSLNFRNNVVCNLLSVPRVVCFVLRWGFSYAVLSC